jgi:arylformamidase
MSTPAIYRGYDQAGLDAQYNNQRTVPDYQSITVRHRRDTEEAKRRYRWQEAAYGPTAAERLDLYLPECAPAPVLVFVHGGAWRLLSKEDSGFAAPAWLEAGFVFVALDFALSPAVSLDEIVRQVRAAVAWLWTSVHRFGGDPRRIHVAGHSSGAHLVSQCLVADWTRDFGCPSDVIKSAIFVSGLGDLEPVRLSYRNSGLKLDEAAVKRLSLVRQQPAVRCPLVCAYASGDTDEFRRQTREVAQHWQRHGLEASLIELAGRNHFDGAYALAEPDHPLFRASVEVARRAGQASASSNADNR